MNTTERLVVELPSELVEKLRSLVAAGEFKSESQAVETMLKACYNPDDPDEAEIAEIRAAIAEADADIAAGRVHEADEVFKELHKIIAEHETRRD